MVLFQCRNAGNKYEEADALVNITNNKSTSEKQLFLHQSICDLGHHRERQTSSGKITLNLRVSGSEYGVLEYVQVQGHLDARHMRERERERKYEIERGGLKRISSSCVILTVDVSTTDYELYFNIYMSTCAHAGFNVEVQRQRATHCLIVNATCQMSDFRCRIA